MLYPKNKQIIKLTVGTCPHPQGRKHALDRALGGGWGGDKMNNKRCAKVLLFKHNECYQSSASTIIRTTGGVRLKLMGP